MTTLNLSLLRATLDSLPKGALMFNYQYLTTQNSFQTHLLQSVGSGPIVIPCPAMLNNHYTPITLFHLMLTLSNEDM